MRAALPRRADARLLRRLVACAVVDPYRPIMAHLVVTRRCNLSCGYCYEYDHVSPPVPTAVLRERLAHLSRLRTVLVTLTGGESLLHPDLPEVVAAARELGMTPVMNSNGYLLSAERVDALNRAGLYAMQISIDNLEPNHVSKKSLRPLLPKLRMLAERARFRVRINTVLGAESPREAVEVARAVVGLGFEAKCSLVRDDAGAVRPPGDEARVAYDEIRALGRRAPGYLGEEFQAALIDDGRVSWKCRAGARYFTVCERGLVHLCESSYGYPGTPLAAFGEGDIRRHFATQKACASTCAVAYAHQASQLDRWRGQAAAAARVDKRSWTPGPASQELVQLRASKCAR